MASDYLQFTLTAFVPLLGIGPTLGHHAEIYRSCGREARCPLSEGLPIGNQRILYEASEPEKDVYLDPYPTVPSTIDQSVIIVGNAVAAKHRG